jgi:rhomboid protease GluP
MVSGFAGVVASFVFTLAPSLGSSTAIFGLLGAHAVFAYKNQGVFGPQARRALRSIVNIAVINLVIGLSPGIDNWGHVGGLIGGLVISWVGGPVYSLQGSLPVMEAVNLHDDRDLVAGVVSAGIIFIVIAAATMIYRLY